jgi:hypothetical protein
MKALYACLVAATLVACSSIQAAQIQVGDRCLRCRRPIGDLRVAAEIIDRMRAPFPFRTAGCMAKYIKANPDEQPAAIFVTDYKTGRMVQANDAWFVPTQLTQPDGRKAEADYLAFRSRSDAEAARTERQPLLRWAQVVAEAPAN